MFKFLKRLLGKEDELEYRLSRGMKVGKNSHLFSVSTIDGAWPWLISFGDNVTVSSDVHILAHDASPNIVGCETKLGRVDIGNNVFIGVGATILCNVRIGDNVIVGAGSVVANDLPGNAVYTGNPAKRICSIEEFKEKQRAQRENRPDFSKMHRWDEWINASDEDKKKMREQLEDGCGYV